MADHRKREARDIQQRTGWSYQFCQRMVSALGYEAVSDAVDESTDVEAAGRALNERVKAKARGEPWFDTAEEKR